jgi:hypothetical protein
MRIVLIGFMVRLGAALDRFRKLLSAFNVVAYPLVSALVYYFVNRRDYEVWSVHLDVMATPLGDDMRAVSGKVCQFLLRRDPGSVHSFGETIRRVIRIVRENNQWDVAK